MKTPGIYVNTPTNLNTKCVVFGGILSLLYWFIPNSKNIFMIPAIFTVAYVVMAWYDEMYGCQDRLYSGSSSWGMAILDSIFKPQRESSLQATHLAEQHSPKPPRD